MRIQDYLKKKAKLVDRYLDRFLPDANVHPKVIHRAMRYSVFSGGKRLRPILAMEACSVYGGRLTDVIATACALELIHTYSIIHDDLPSMDNDDYRRGKPSLHRKFDEAIAILAGDALLSLSFNLMTKGKNTSIQRCVINDVSRAIGTFGMIGGQVMDITVKKKKGVSALKYIHAHKTAALIAVCVRAGAIIAKAPKEKIETLTDFGKFLGLSFQIIDDLLDKEDYYKLFGKDASRKAAERLIDRAKASLKPFGKKADRLREIADFVLVRGK